MGPRNLNVSPRLTNGILIWDVHATDGSGGGCVDEFGQYAVHGAPRQSTIAIIKSLSEWYQADQAHFRGQNAAKIKREILS